MKHLISIILTAVIMCCSLYIFASAEEFTSYTEITEAPVTEITEATEAPTEPDTYQQITDATVTEATTSAVVVETEAVQTEKVYTTRKTQSYNYETNADDDEEYYSKTTVSVPSTTPTTTKKPAKKVADFGKNYAVWKWIAFVIMLLSAGALVFINVRNYQIKQKQAARRRTGRPQSPNRPSNGADPGTKRPVNRPDNMPDDFTDISSRSDKKD